MKRNSYDLTNDTRGGYIASYDSDGHLTEIATPKGKWQVQKPVLTVIEAMEKLKEF